MNPPSPVNPDPRRSLPSVDRLVAELERRAPDAPRWALLAVARDQLREARDQIARDGAAIDLENVIAKSLRQAARLAEPAPGPVLNATGVVLHTNLGRAPLAEGAVRAATLAAAGYSDLELDLSTGKRGKRGARVADKLVRLSGAEAATAVNNNAAAVMLALDTLARGREVIVSRGELVEIGGSFRVPDIMERAGVRLVEVGTTNRTHPRDYENAIGPDTALLLKVHRSNFEVRGFVSEVGLPELAAIGRERGLPVVEDLGSGTLVELPGLPAEAFAPARLAQGADVVCFSGDKLLGGPQAGIILGSAEQVHAMRRNPLARALRLDKLSLAALDWTLGVYLEGRAREEIPVLRQLCEAEEALEKRARALAERLDRPAGAGMTVKAEAQTGFVGGGSVPGFELPGWVVALEPASGAETIAARLRGAPVPVLPRVRDGRLLLDVRTLLPGDEADVEAALAHALQERR